MSEKKWASYIVGQFGAVAGVLTVLGLLIMSMAWVVWAFKVLEEMFQRR
jgi:urea transporter